MQLNKPITMKKTSLLYRGLRIALAYLPFAAVLLAFVGFFSYSNQNFSLPQVNIALLLLSFITLLLVFLFRVLLWQALLQRAGYTVSFPLACLALCRSLVLKYLPGKIWGVLGRAGYIHQYADLPLLPLSILASVYQLLSGLFGLLVGLLGLILFALPLGFLGIWLVVLVGILWWLATPRSIPESWIKMLPGQWLKTIVSETKEMPALIGIAVGIFLQWLLLGLAYLLFFAAWVDTFMLPLILLQPLAHFAGIAAFFTPGGLGVREGVTAFYLVELGIASPLALALGILSRFWFFAAELLLFAASFLVRNLQKTILPNFIVPL